MSARQLLADRLKHGSSKYTWDPPYQAQERAESRNLFSKQLNTNLNSQHNMTTNHAVKVGANDNTSEKITEENDMTEHIDPHVKTFASEEIDTSVPTEAFENDLLSQNATAFVEHLVHENFHALVEKYASHVGGSFLLRYVLLVTVVHSATASRILTGDPCNLDEAPIEFSEPDDTSLFLALGVLIAFDDWVWIDLRFTRLLKDQVASLRERHAQLAVDHPELQAERRRLQQRVIELNTQITDKHTEGCQLRDALLTVRGQVVDLQFVVDDHAAIGERETSRSTLASQCH